MNKIALLLMIASSNAHCYSSFNSHPTTTTSKVTVSKPSAVSKPIIASKPQEPVKVVATQSSTFGNKVTYSATVVNKVVNAVAEQKSTAIGASSSYAEYADKERQKKIAAEREKEQTERRKKDSEQPKQSTQVQAQSQPTIIVNHYHENDDNTAIVRNLNSLSLINALTSKRQPVSVPLIQNTAPLFDAAVKNANPALQMCFTDSIEHGKIEALNKTNLTVNPIAVRGSTIDALLQNKCSIAITTKDSIGVDANIASITNYDKLSMFLACNKNKWQTATSIYVDATDANSVYTLEYLKKATQHKANIVSSPDLEYASKTAYGNGQCVFTMSGALSKNLKVIQEQNLTLQRLPLEPKVNSNYQVEVMSIEHLLRNMRGGMFVTKYPTLSVDLLIVTTIELKNANPQIYSLIQNEVAKVR